MAKSRKGKKHQPVVLATVQEREAEFWTPLEGGAVQCELCYRRCQIPAGGSGWCRSRRNEAGRMRLAGYGLLSDLARTRLGYDAPLAADTGAICLIVGGFRCSASCDFCANLHTIHHPERLKLAAGPLWRNSKAQRSPSEVVDLAISLKADHLVIDENEPLVSWEYTYDMARLAKNRGLAVCLFTNGLSGAEAVRRLAPLVDAVNVGVKGFLHPPFYRDRMKAPPPAVDAVKEAAKAWKDAGVHTILSSLVPVELGAPPEAWDEIMGGFYEWIKEALGALSIVETAAECRPGQRTINVGNDQASQLAYMRLMNYAIKFGQETLPYCKAIWDGYYCHECGSTLLEYAAPECEQGIPDYCDHVQNVTDGHCDHCGVEVPIRCLAPEEVARLRRLLTGEL